MTFWDFLDKHIVLTCLGGFAVFVWALYAMVVADNMIGNISRASVLKSTVKKAMAEGRKVKVDL